MASAPQTDDAPIGDDHDELLSAWKAVENPPTQWLGRAVLETGLIEGILYPSSRNRGGTCMLIFPGRFRKGSSILFRSKNPGLINASIIL